MTRSEALYRGDWSSVDCICEILNKRESVSQYVRTMLNRTNQMFEYSGLPETIPAEILELFLQIGGQICITEYEGKLYALPGGLGGPPDPYYRPTLYVLANPGLGYSASLEIVNHLPPFAKTSSQGKCVLVKNDTLMEGLFYTFSRYATQLTENDISIRSAQINARAHVNIVADTDAEAVSAKAYLDGLEAGKLGIIQGKPMMDSMKVANLSMNSANVIIQLIELQQYLKASWYNEIGLNANFNMKREYQSEEELQANTDVLLPLVDNMLKCRQDAFSVVNSTYGTNITVKKNSSWENKQNERDVEHEIKEAEVESMKDGDSNV